MMISSQELIFQIPWLVIGMFGGLVAAVGMPAPSKRFMLVSMLRSMLVSVAAANALIDLGWNKNAIISVAFASSYCAEQILHGLARLSDHWATNPLGLVQRVSSLLAAMRVARGLSDEDSRNRRDRRDADPGP